VVNKDSWSDLLENAPSHHGFLFFFFTGGKFLLKDLVSKSPNGCAFFQAVGLKEHFFF